MFDAWLSEQRAQDKADGVSFRTLATDPQQLTGYIRTHLDDLYASLDSAARTVPPSVMDARLQWNHWEVSRDGFVGHLAQVMESVAHLLLAVGCRGEELEKRYHQELALAGALPEEAPVEAADAAPAESSSEKVTTFVVKTLRERKDALPVNAGLLGKLVPVRDMDIPKQDDVASPVT